MDFFKGLVLVVVAFVVIGVGMGIIGCGVAVGVSVRTMLHQTSDYHNVSFRYANFCSRGLWTRLFKDKTYIVLLQNTAELRATGGFMGSYARLKFDNKGVSDISVEDIYTPDGQLVGHVEPPYPIQEAFGQGWWRLRDSNWDVDFASAAGSVKWFFEQGGEKHVDGIIATNLGLFQRWMGVLGSVKLATYDDIVTESNLYSLAQKYAEVDFKPGSDSKRDFLGAVGVKLLEMTKQATVVDQWRLARLVYDQAQIHQILLWSNDTIVEKTFDQLGWTGRLGTAGVRDYLYIVEDNLGGNKANTFVTRDVQQSMLADSNQIQIEWNNTNPFSVPRPPIFWGGDYFAYTRIVVPQTYVVGELKVGERVLKRRDAVTANLPPSVLTGRSEGLYDVVFRDGFEMVGFWVRVPAKKHQVARLSFVGNKIGKSILLRRQPGIDHFMYSLQVDGKIVKSIRVDQDLQIGW